MPVASKNLAHRFDVRLLEDVLPAEQVATRDHQREHHGEAAEDGARDEVRAGRWWCASPGAGTVAKSIDTTEWTEKTSGVESAAMIR